MRTFFAILALLAMLTLCAQDRGKRRMTPINNAATATQAVNETATDTARINTKRRAQSISYIDDRGRTMYVDTVTGQEWTDSTTLKNIVPRMEQPLLHALSVGVNIWDPVMRIFGQDHGIVSAWAELSLHNRYKPLVELGLGTAAHHGPNENYIYRSPMSVFFKFGANYNFLFNSNPAYQLYAGLRFGFTPFTYKVDDVILDSPYWDETARFTVPSQKATASYMELCLGLRVQLWGPVSAGWEFKYHSIMHCTKGEYGNPWYIPGYGARGGSITGSFSIVYTLPLTHLNKKAAQAVINPDNEVEGLLPPP